MRSIKNIELFNSKRSIIRSFNDNKFNLILTPRQWGLTTLLIDYINQIPHDKTIFFALSNPAVIRDITMRITHPDCWVQSIKESSVVGRRFDYIICDNFFNGSWLKNLILLAPSLKEDGKIILADSGRYLGDHIIEHFREYNKIIKTSLD